MIRLPSFELLMPETLTEAATLFANAKRDSQLLAGGTDLLVAMKNQVAHPQQLISLECIQELRSITQLDPDGLSIGAMITLAEIASSNLVQEHFSALAEAAGAVASPAIRSRATLGGNLCVDTRCFYVNQSEFWRDALGGCLKTDAACSICHAAPGAKVCGAVFASDTAPVLIAHDASIRILYGDQIRTIKLRELYQNDGAAGLTLRPGEIITHIILPHTRSNFKAAFRKVRRRKSIDFAVVNVAVALTLNEQHVCESASVVLGAVSSAPVLLSEATSLLQGNCVTEALIEQVASAARDYVKPLPNVHESISYRKQMIHHITRDALTSLL